MPDLSVRGLLAGIRSGRVFVDVDGSRDRILDLHAVAGDRRAAMGETLTVASDSAVRFEIDVRGVSAGTVQLIVDGRRDAVYAAALDPHRPLVVGPWRGDGDAHWGRAGHRCRTAAPPRYLVGIAV